MRRIVMGSVILAIAPLSVIGVALTSTTWWEALFLALTLLFTTTLIREWNLDGYTPRAVFLFIFAGAAYAYGAFSANSPIGFMPFALVGALLVMKVRAHRVSAVILLAAGVAALGAASLLTNPLTPALVIQFIVVPAVGTLYISAAVFVGELAWTLLAHTLREATTNLLRHADPTGVTITASPVGVEVSNDGAPAGREIHHRGLARLANRITDAGGELDFTQQGDVFTVSARMAPLRSAPTSAGADEVGLS